MTPLTPTIAELIGEAKEAIQNAIEALAQARIQAEEIRDGILIPEKDHGLRRQGLDRRTDLIEFNLAVVKAERTLQNIITEKRKKVPGRFARILEFPVKDFESWDDAKYADDFLDMKISESLGK